MSEKIKFCTLLSLLIFFVSCERRELEEEYKTTALIPVKIDWSLSYVQIEKMHRATVKLFPKDGSKPLEYRLERDLTSTVIEVPIGSYSVIVFNETTDEADWDYLGFRNLDKYDRFLAHVLGEKSKGFYVASEELPLVTNPEPLAAWRLDDFEVTADLVAHTRAKSKSKTKASFSEKETKALESSTRALSSVQPIHYTQTIIVRAHIKNLSSAMQATGLLRQFCAGIYMSSRERISYAVAHPFLLAHRIYDDNGKDGIIETSFDIFGKQSDDSLPSSVELDIILNNGKGFPTLQFDITALLKGHGHDPIIIIDLDSIELPDVPKEGEGVEVGDWDEVIIPIK